MNIIDEMAKQLEKLGCNDTHFVNTNFLQLQAFPNMNYYKL